MLDLRDYPLLVFLISFLTLWFSEKIAATYFRRHRKIQERSEDFGLILAAALTLLGLIIGFSFSMAVTRYDQRKNYEEAEANAIGTEYVRAELLPAADAAQLRTLLLKYLDQRILYYTTRDEQRLAQIDAATAQLQDELWSAVREPAAAQPTPIAALVVSGMNDVLNSQGYTQAAWWNRIPIEAWALMGAIAVCANLLFGYTARRAGVRTKLFVILPLIVSIAFVLIADLDSPRGGIIRVSAPNLIAVSNSMRTAQFSASSSSSSSVMATSNTK